MSRLFDGLEKEMRVPVSQSNAQGRPKSDAALDLWLKHHLSQLYGPVVDDSISDELLKRLKDCLG
jgi:hypothetical protein